VLIDFDFITQHNRKLEVLKYVFLDLRLGLWCLCCGRIIQNPVPCSENVIVEWSVLYVVWR